MDLDISDYTESEKRAWIDASIVRGPVYPRPGFVEAQDYVATVEWFREKDGHAHREFTDIYVIQSPGRGQCVCYRSEDDVETDNYGWMEIASLLKSHYLGSPWSSIIGALLYKGKILWQRGGV